MVNIQRIQQLSAVMQHCEAGRTRNPWLQQIADGTPFGIGAEWTRARRREHAGTGLTQRTSPIYVI